LGFIATVDFQTEAYYPFCQFTGILNPEKNPILYETGGRNLEENIPP